MKNNLANNLYLDTTKGNWIVLEVETSSHRVDDRLWLFKDFLLHKVLVIAFHDLLNFHLQNSDFTGMRVVQCASQSVNAQCAVFYCSNIVILGKNDCLLKVTEKHFYKSTFLSRKYYYLQEDDAVGVLNHRTSIRCEKVFDFFLLQWLEFWCALASWHQWNFGVSAMRAMV